MSTQEEPPGEWQVLFDGTEESLQTHWTGFRMGDIPGGWHVENGTLALSSGAEHGGGHLMTKEQFGDFILELDWKLSEGGNSGIFYLVTEEEPVPEYTGPEFQVVSGENAGANFDMHAPSVNAARPAGEWNHVRIVLQDRHVEHWLNGEKVVEYELGSEKWKKLKAESKFAGRPYGRAERGHIVLQDHGDDVWYRDIKIQPLD